MESTVDYYSIRSKLSRFKQVILNWIAYLGGGILLYGFLIYLFIYSLTHSEDTNKTIKRINHGNSRRYKKHTPPSQSI